MVHEAPSQIPVDGVQSICSIVPRRENSRVVPPETGSSRRVVTVKTLAHGSQKSSNWRKLCELSATPFRALELLGTHFGCNTCVNSGGDCSDCIDDCRSCGLCGPHGRYSRCDRTPEDIFRSVVRIVAVDRLMPNSRVGPRFRRCFRRGTHSVQGPSSRNFVRIRQHRQNGIAGC